MMTATNPRLIKLIECSITISSSLVYTNRALHLTHILGFRTPPRYDVELAHFPAAERQEKWKSAACTMDAGQLGQWVAPRSFENVITEGLILHLRCSREKGSAPVSVHQLSGY